MQAAPFIQEYDGASIMETFSGKFKLLAMSDTRLK